MNQAAEAFCGGDCQICAKRKRRSPQGKLVSKVALMLDTQGRTNFTALRFVTERVTRASNLLRRRRRTCEVASAAGNTGLPDILALSKSRCHWRCKSSGPSCRGAGGSCFAGSGSVTFERSGIRVRTSAGSCCNLLSISAFACSGSGVWP